MVILFQLVNTRLGKQSRIDEDSRQDDSTALKHNMQHKTFMFNLYYDVGRAIDNRKRRAREHYCKPSSHGRRVSEVSVPRHCPTTAGTRQA